MKAYIIRVNGWSARQGHPTSYETRSIALAHSSLLQSRRGETLFTSRLGCVGLLRRVGAGVGWGDVVGWGAIRDILYRVP